MERACFFLKQCAEEEGVVYFHSFLFLSLSLARKINDTFSFSLLLSDHSAYFFSCAKLFFTVTFLFFFVFISQYAVFPKIHHSPLISTPTIVKERYSTTRQKSLSDRGFSC